jgi:hypothetical protein
MNWKKAVFFCLRGSTASTVNVKAKRVFNRLRNECIIISRNRIILFDLTRTVLVEEHKTSTIYEKRKNTLYIYIKKEK